MLTQSQDQALKQIYKHYFIKEYCPQLAPSSDLELHSLLSCLRLCKDFRLSHEILSLKKVFYIWHIVYRELGPHDAFNKLANSADTVLN